MDLLPELPLLLLPDSPGPGGRLRGPVHGRSGHAAIRRGSASPLSAALRDLYEQDAAAAERYIELTAQGLGTGPIATFWRALVDADTSFFVSPLAEGIREEGRERGRAEGHRKGYAEGKTAGAAMALLRLLHRRGVPFSPDERGRIVACGDMRLLERWFDRAVVAATTADVFTDD